MTNGKEFQVGDLVQYKNKLHIITDKQTNLIGGNGWDTFMYRLHDESRWILGQFVYEVEE